MRVQESLKGIILAQIYDKQRIGRRSHTLFKPLWPPAILSEGQKKRIICYTRAFDFLKLWQNI